MIINKEINKYLPFKDLENMYVVADFDRTITNGSSKTSWSILASSDLVPKSYVEERQKLYDYYRPIEINEKLDLQFKMNAMKDWYQKHIELFVKYKISEEVFKTASTNLRIMEFRPGAREFIEFLHKNNIPLIIISAGIGNFIEEFLKHNNCYFNNVFVSSNKINFKNGIAVGVGKNIIHSLNKNEVSLPDNISLKLKNRKQVILLGDQISDLNMVQKDRHDLVLSVGFITDECKDKLDVLKANFDIVCQENDDYYKLKDLLF